ncbi:hypothetical protein [Paenibacillus sp. CCS19]|uniref:hypothetical protein n=1 Tax=Paenibacillus sp. CCS19 TaxID=3158387 RepID=UPI00295ECA48|nr:hypothetical protein [Paenibacillus cellulosilyticus]
MLRNQLNKDANLVPGSYFLIEGKHDTIGISLEESTKSIAKLAAKISTKLDTVVINLKDNDLFWACTFYRDGTAVSSIRHGYDSLQSDFIEEVLLPLIADSSAYEELLHQLLSSALKGQTLIKFLQAFGLEPYQGMEYRFLELEDRDELERKHIVFYEKSNPKKLTVRAIQDVIVHHAGEFLQSKGYRYQNKTNDRVLFLKQINGYRYEIMFNLATKQCVVITYMHPSFDEEDIEWLQQHGYTRFIHFATQIELVKGLDQLLIDIAEVGIPWLESNEMEDMDLLSVYEGLVDPTLAKYGYERTQTDDRLIDTGGIVVYQGKYTIVFQHVVMRGKFRAYVDQIHFDEYFIRSQMAAHMMNDEKLVPVDSRGFKNTEEFRKEMSKYLHWLECFLTTGY